MVLDKKDARGIALYFMFVHPRNAYQENIRNAARTLVDRGDGAYIYQTQWSSGTTLWRNPISGCTVTIKGSA